MRLNILVIGIIIISAILITGCSSVKEVDDVTIIENPDSIGKIATDTGFDKIDAELINLGDLDETSEESMEETVNELNIEEVNSDLIEFGELI